jgi:hypothetical protein
MGKHFSGEITGAEPKVFTPGEDMEFHVSWSADLLSGGSGWHSWVEAKYGLVKMLQPHYHTGAQMQQFQSLSVMWGATFTG